MYPIALRALRVTRLSITMVSSWRLIWWCIENSVRPSPDRVDAGVRIPASRPDHPGAEQRSELQPLQLCPEQPAELYGSERLQFLQEVPTASAGDRHNHLFATERVLHEHPWPGFVRLHGRRGVSVRDCIRWWPQGGLVRGLQRVVVLWHRRSLQRRATGQRWLPRQWPVTRCLWREGDGARCCRWSDVDPPGWQVWSRFRQRRLYRRRHPSDRRQRQERLCSGRRICHRWRNGLDIEWRQVRKWRVDGRVFVRVQSIATPRSKLYVG